MVGTTGPRMLRLAAQHADADPATLARTAAVLVQVEGEEAARRGGLQEKAPPLRGSPAPRTTPSDYVASAPVRLEADPRCESIAHVLLWRSDRDPRRCLGLPKQTEVDGLLPVELLGKRLDLL